MKNHGVRVVIASERPEARYFLQRVVEGEGGVTVGQASDAPKTLALVADVKPDLAIIDSDLPYVANLHTLPLSRVGGLDTAQRITREVPGTGAVVLNNLDTVVMDHAGAPPHGGSTCSLKSIENNLPLVIRNLGNLAARPGGPVFANIECKPEELPVSKGDNPADRVIFFGVIAIALGWFLIISWISATVGAAVALAGITVVILAMAGKMTAPFWHRLFGRKP